MKQREVREVLLRIANDMLAKGPGFAQERTVLTAARRELGPVNVEQEQVVLDVWHSLFDERELAWGFDLDNPREPFFHLPTPGSSPRVG